MMKKFYALSICVWLMYIVSALSIVGALTVIAIDDYPDVVQAAVIVAGLTSAFMCACWGDYIRLQLALYDLRYTATDLDVRNYKAQVAKSEPAPANTDKKRPKRIVPINGRKQKHLARG